jgi:hypothetical protein
MPQQRLSGPEAIQRGGFTGGVSAGAAPPPQGNSLLDLANGLANFTGAFNRTSAQVMRNEEQNKRVATDLNELETKKQRDEAAQESETMIATTLAGYNSNQIGEAIESEPLARQFKQNPYILPAIQIHRGRVAADESVQAMVSAGVDVRDAEAFNGWLRDNAPQSSDPFLAQGFNEQMQRNQAQFAQMQLKDTLEKADYDRVQAAGREFKTALQDTSDSHLTAEQRVSVAFQALASAPGLKGHEATDIQLSELREAAGSGDLEMASALAKTKRGEAPALLDDANVSAQAATYLKQAETRFDLYQKVDAGISLPGLRAEPGMALLKKEDPEKYGQVLNRWQETTQQAANQAKAAGLKSIRQAYRTDAAKQASDFILQGKGEFIQDVDVDLPDGSVFTVSGETAKQHGLEIARDRVFPNGILAVPDDHMENFREYTRKVADSHMKDPQLAGYLEGVAAYLTPEGIVGNENDVAYGYKVYKHMDPAVAATYFTDPKSRAVFQKMDELTQRNPSLTADQAAIRAVTQVFSSAPKLPVNKTIKVPADAITIKDPLNSHDKMFGLFGQAANIVTPDRERARAFLADRASEYMAQGMTDTTSIAKATEDFSTEHTVVNGSVVQLPPAPSEGPTKGRETPAKFAQAATDALKAVAKADGTDDIKGYQLSNVSGEVYLIRKPNGDQDYVTAQSLRRLSQEWAKKTQEDAAAERQAKADAAAARRRNHASGISFPEVKTIR